MTNRATNELNRTQAAQIPIKDDAAANEAALELVRKDKLREVRAGHDGTWAAHPGLIPAIREVFEGHLGGRPNQIGDAAGHEGASVREEDLIQIGSERNLRESLAIVDQYMTEAIAARKATPSDDLLSRFMKKRDDNGKAFLEDVLQWITLNFMLATDRRSGDGRARLERLSHGTGATAGRLGEQL